MRRLEEIVSKNALFGIVLCLSLVALTGCGEKKSAPPAGGGGGAKTDTPTAGAPAATLDPATAGVIKGIVTFGNEPEVMPGPIEEMKGPKGEGCGTHATPPIHGWYQVGENKGAGDVIVYAKSGPATNVRTPVPADEAHVDQVNCIYTPRSIAIRAGQPLRFKSDDATSHNVNFAAKINEMWNMTMQAKTSFLAGEGSSKKIGAAEFNPPIKLKCDIHPWMSANLAVFNHDAFAVTKKDGKFELKNLPPGEYEIEVFHERAKAKSQKVTLGAKETKEIKFEIKFLD